MLINFLVYSFSLFFPIFQTINNERQTEKLFDNNDPYGSAPLILEGKTHAIRAG